MTTVDIPGGQATFREKLATERQRRPIKRAALAASAAIAKLPTERDEDGNLQEMLAALPLSAAEADSLLSLYDATIVAFLESWTLPGPLPADQDALLDLDGDVYDALLNAASKLRGAAVEQTDFAPTGDPGDGSPTGP